MVWIHYVNTSQHNCHKALLLRWKRPVYPIPSKLNEIIKTSNNWKPTVGNLTRFVPSPGMSWEDNIRRNSALRNPQDPSENPSSIPCDWLVYTNKYHWEQALTERAFSLSLFRLILILQISLLLREEKLLVCRAALNWKFIRLRQILFIAPNLS